VIISLSKFTEKRMTQIANRSKMGKQQQPCEMKYTVSNVIKRTSLNAPSDPPQHYGVLAPTYKTSQPKSKCP
jgi:hypothetical protein